MISKKDIAALVFVLLAYSAYFIADTRSPDFVYAHNAELPIEAFDTLESFSVDHYIAPWRYRILPRLLQWQLYQGIKLFTDIPFLWVALGLSCLFMAVSLAGFYLLLRFFGLSIPWALVGWALASSSFPIVFGYRVRNWMSIDDALAYALLLAGLLVLFFGRGTRRYGWFTAISVLAALTRETTLLLAVVVLFDKRIPFLKRAALAAPSLVAFLGVRVLLFETSEVTTAAGLPVPRLDLNLVEEGLVLTSAYTFAVFGTAWLLAAFGWFYFYKQHRQLSDSFWLFWITTPVVAGMLGGFNLLIGSIRENRIWFLVFPWVVGLGVVYLSQRWSSLATLRHARGVGLLLLILAVPAALFLLLVPGGGGGQRLGALLAIPGMAFAHEAIWLPFYYRFNWIAGQLEHVLVHLGLSVVLLAWYAVDLWIARVPPPEYTSPQCPPSPKS